MTLAKMARNERVVRKMVAASKEVWYTHLSSD
jgi:hypothetical protein